MDWQQNQELEEKYQNSQSFRKQMNKINQKFKEFQQQALYSDLQQSAKQMILSIPAGSQHSKHLHWIRKTDLFLIIGAKQLPNSIEKILLNLIHAIPRPKKSFTIVYINTLAHKNAFSDFMKMTQLLPIQYFRHLDLLYVLQASFMSKALTWGFFNVITSYLKTKTIHVAEFKELADRTQANQVALLRLLPSEIRSTLGQNELHVEFLLANKAMKLVTMEDLALKHTKSQNQPIKSCNNVNQQKVQLPARSSTFPAIQKKPKKHEIEDYMVGQTGAPLTLQMLIYYFNERECSLQYEGIFRKSVSIDEQNQILWQLQANNYDYIETVKDPHIIANAIKRFLANLLTPIIPFPVFQELMEADQSRILNLTIESIKGLSETRKKTLLIIVQFFLEKVIPKEDKNKMGLKNICIVIGPCIMWSKIPSFKDLIYSQKIIAVTSILFKQFVKIFGNKKERTLALRKSVKEFNKAYIQERLGLNQSKLACLDVKPCELTKSQMDIIRQSRKKTSIMQQNEYGPSQKGDIQADIYNKVHQTIIEDFQDQLQPEDLQIQQQQSIKEILLHQQPKLQPAMKQLETLGINQVSQDIIQKQSQDI